MIENHSKSTKSINIIFTSNEYLLSINKEYLNHNYHTDVITFEYNDEKLISGDIFVSVEQVRINALNYQKSFENELSRVVIHGVLHLLGYNDTLPQDVKEIRKEEDDALMLLNQ